MKTKNLLSGIEREIEKCYEEIKEKGEICKGIEDVHRNVRFEHPELAVHIKKRMIKIAKERSDLP